MQDFENGEKPNNGDTELMIEDRHCFGSFPLDTRNNSSQLTLQTQLVWCLILITEWNCGGKFRLKPKVYTLVEHEATLHWINIIPN